MNSVKLRTPDAAKFLCLSVTTLAKMRLRGDGPTYAKAGRICLYDINDLDAWLNENKHQSTSEY